MYDYIVPQELNIADRIGKFTFTQLGFLAAGILVVMIMFITDSIPMWVSLLIGVPFFVLCLTLAFVKRYDMPLYEFLIILIIYKSLPKEMIYSATESENETYDFEEEKIDEKELENMILS
ncbi:PrgI family protein [Bacillus mexicanus]|uniref:PrgI family protein n=1 Tax=Bacillus mexicanus TaxID=2834415 RepID=UPI003D1A2366